MGHTSLQPSFERVFVLYGGRRDSSPRYFAKVAGQFEPILGARAAAREFWRSGGERPAMQVHLPTAAQLRYILRGTETNFAGRMDLRENLGHGSYSMRNLFFPLDGLVAFTAPGEPFESKVTGPGPEKGTRLVLHMGAMAGRHSDSLVVLPHVMKKHIVPDANGEIHFSVGRWPDLRLYPRFPDFPGTPLSFWTNNGGWPQRRSRERRNRTERGDYSPKVVKLDRAKGAFFGPVIMHIDWEARAAGVPTLIMGAWHPKKTELLVSLSRRQAEALVREHGVPGPLSFMA